MDLRELKRHRVFFLTILGGRGYSMLARKKGFYPAWESLQKMVQASHFITVNKAGILKEWGELGSEYGCQGQTESIVIQLMTGFQTRCDAAVLTRDKTT